MPAGSNLNPDVPEPLLQFFVYEHLPEGKLRDASRPFCLLAEQIVASFPRNAERTVCLRKLLEAKDAGVRTWIFEQPGQGEGTPTAAAVALDIERQGRVTAFPIPDGTLVPQLGD